MKWIKLFENFKDNEKKLEERISEISDVYNDIKSLEYILEDDGYNITWKLVTNFRNSYAIEGDISDLIRTHSFTDGGIFTHEFMKEVNIRMNIEYVSKPYSKISNKMKSDLLRFKSLLSEHLDYIPSDSIKIDFDFFYTDNSLSARIVIENI